MTKDKRNKQISEFKKALQLLDARIHFKDYAANETDLWEFFRHKKYQPQDESCNKQDESYTPEVARNSFERMAKQLDDFMAMATDSTTTAEMAEMDTEMAKMYDSINGGANMPRMAKPQPDLSPLDTSVPNDEVREFEESLSKKVIGQPEAVKTLVSAYKVFLAGMQTPHHPINNLLFLGPTGTGKTRTIEAAVDILFGSPEAFIKIDCAEYQHGHEISKLVGAPAGFIGHRETTPLITQQLLDKNYTEKHKFSFILFDEIEKASDTLWQLLLGVLDKATLTLGDNRRVDFSQCIVVMTSNLGTAEMAKMHGHPIGFSKRLESANVASTQAKVALNAAKHRFSPEFMNRLDGTVVFKQLQKEHLRRIFNLEMQAVQDRIISNKCKSPIFILEWTDAAANLLIDEGTSAEYGARELKRTIERHVVQPISDLILSRKVDNADTLTLDAKNGEIKFMHTPR